MGLLSWWRRRRRSRAVVQEIESAEMPRPTKAFRRLKVNAAAAYKRGEKQEAHKLWEKASASLKEHTENKRNKKAKAAAAKAAEGGDS